MRHQQRRTPIKKTRIRPIFPVLAACCVFLISAEVVAGPDENPNKISANKLTSLLENINPTVFYGGVMIPAADTLRGPVVTVDGALDVQDGGVLVGDAWVVNGRLILTGRAVVLGVVHLVNSEAFSSHLAEVAGGLERYACECRIDAEKLEKQGKLAFLKQEDPLAIKTKLAIHEGRPTRVKYYLLRLGLERRNPRHPKPHVSGHALVDVPLWPDTRGYLGFDADVSVPLWGTRVSLLARGFKKVVSNDEWQISSGENTWMLAWTGWEFSDYFERRGGEVGLEFEAREFLKARVLVSYGRDVSLETHDAPSLFKSNQRLRNNPAVDDGNRMAVSGSVTYDSREDPVRPRNAWFIDLWAEKGLADGPGEFSYTAASVDLCRYTRLPFGLQWDVRGKLFTSFDRVPRQLYRSLNGYGGVRGLDDSPFAVHRGDRLALVSAELRRALPEVPVFRTLFSRWKLLLFGDLGLLEKTESVFSPLDFLGAEFDNWGKTAGVGITGESFLPYVGLYLAQDLDGHRRSTRVILRVNRSF